MSELPDAASDGRYDKTQTRLGPALAPETGTWQARQAADKAAEYYRPRVNAANHTKAEISYFSWTAFPRLIGGIPKDWPQDRQTHPAKVQSTAVSS